MHFSNISCDSSLLLPTFYSEIIICLHLSRPKLGSWSQFGEKIAGIGPVYFFHSLFSGRKQNTLPRGQMNILVFIFPFQGPSKNLFRYCIK
jgi:hypothetical protein